MGQKLASELRQYYLQRKYAADEDHEPEEFEVNAVRYRPTSIDAICRRTKFSRRELQLMYRGFKQGCPTGIVSLSQFKDIYAQFFPQGRSAKYAQFVFNTFDRDRNDIITFEEFVVGLSILCRGTMDDKLAWVFDLYDIRRRGFICRDEMLTVVQSIYDLMGDDTDPPLDDRSVIEHVTNIFKKMDENHDGQVTREEFISTCKSDPAISDSLSLFDTQL